MNIVKQIQPKLISKKSLNMVVHLRRSLFLIVNKINQKSEKGMQHGMLKMKIQRNKLEIVMPLIYRQIRRFIHLSKNKMNW